MTCGKGLLPPRPGEEGCPGGGQGTPPATPAEANALSAWFAESGGRGTRRDPSPENLGRENLGPENQGPDYRGPVTATGGGRRSEKRREAVFRAGLLFCIGSGLVVLVALLIQVTSKGWPALNFDLLRKMPSTLPARAGIQSALFGTIWVVGLTALMALPIGVGAAVYLEEYARKDRWYNRAIELNIQNLAGVPAIIYGVLGLGLIYRGPLSFGPTVLSAAMTLSLLVLPIVIISSREAIRAVPSSIRLGALALGATQLQTICRQVLPAAVPGIATASILALSRAIGEAAPLLLLGAASYITFNPTGVDSKFTVLPIQILNWVQSPRAEFKILAAAAIVVLLIVLLAMNSLAIFIRNRYQRKW
jgi:phosphate transport system permease protein